MLAYGGTLDGPLVAGGLGKLETASAPHLP
jgi:hypothetical protein